MKLFVRKVIKFARDKWYLIALSFIVATSIIIFFRNSKPTSPKVRPSSSPDFVFEAKNQNFLAQLGNSKSPRPIVSFTSKAGGNVSFELEGKSKASIERKNNIVTFRNVDASTDVSYTPLANGIKEEIILNKPVETAEYIFSLSTVNAKPRKTLENTYSRFFYNNEGQYQFHIEKPFAVDARGKKTENITMQIRGIKDDENKYQVLFSVPANWLNSKDRSYPVTIDPTFIYDTASEYAAGILDRLKSTGSANSPTLETYYQEMPSNPNTVGLWHLNGTPGVVSDSSGYANTGTPTGTTVISGLFGNARRFNGSSDFITVPNSSSVNITGSISVGMWFRRTSGHVPNLIGKGTNNNYSYRLLATNARSGPSSDNWKGGGVTWGINSSYSTMQTNYTLCPAVSPNTVDPCPSEWTHVVGTYDQTDNSVKLYVNGTLVSKGVASGPPVSNSAPVEIGLGRYDGSLFYFGGDMDEIFIKRYAMSPEEIKAVASRRPYGVYTSDIIDFGENILTWNPLLWTELGVATGNGETPFNTTGLVAQWDFNETSNTTANNNAGSCGSSCNGTLTNFASTANQDQAPGGTGWTNGNKRWGAGALMFDGTNDYVSIPDSATLNPGTGNFSIESWFKTSANYSSAAGWIFSNYGVPPTNANGILVNTDNKLQCFFRDGSSNIAIVNGVGPNVNDSLWHHTVCVRQGTTVYSYLDGKLIGSNTNASLGNVNSSGKAKTIGIYADSPNQGMFNGIIDSTRIYSRALTASEVMSNYQAANIEFQTRVGASADAQSSVTDTYNNTTNINTSSSVDYVIGGSGQLSMCITPASPVYVDADGDGYGTGSSVACPVPGTTYATNNSDCDDTSANIHTINATGGTITNAGGYRIHTFTNTGSDTFTVTCPSNITTQVLVVAGGGGGGSSLYSYGGAGGGGGGGYKYNASYSIASGTPVSVTVGDGGSGGTMNAGLVGTSGTGSVFGALTTVGGGGGGSGSLTAPAVYGLAGGSGGGSGYWANSSVPGGSGTSGQGYVGGTGANRANSEYYGGGGGGAGGAANLYTPGNGVAYSISGSNTYYAGGGGGTAPGGIAGGNGGGGKGGAFADPVNSATYPVNGSANTGGGGGGAYGANGPGGRGGSGIVIVRYLNP